MEKNFKYKAEGRLIDILLVNSFLKKNGFAVQREDIDDIPFFARAYFNKDGFDFLLQQDWFLRTDLDVYKLSNFFKKTHRSIK